MKPLLLPLSRFCLFILTALLLVMPSVAPGQDRNEPEEDPYLQLSSKEGVQIEAQILKVEANTVLIVRKDGERFTFPISMLDPQSVKLVQAWAIDQALANSLEIRVRERTLGREKISSTARSGNVKTVQLNFQLTNKSSVTIDNLRIEYRIFVTREEISMPSKEFAQEQIIPGKLDVKQLLAGKELTLEADPIPLKEEKLNANFVPAQGNKRSSQDKVDGYWYRIYRGKNLITENASPRRLMRVKTW